jgi:hypothetical protein
MQEREKEVEIGNPENRIKVASSITGKHTGKPEDDPANQEFKDK